MMPPSDLTKVEKKIFYKLQDGKYHKTYSLLLHIGDVFMETKTLVKHISNLRKKLRPHGMIVIY